MSQITIVTDHFLVGLICRQTQVYIGFVLCASVSCTLVATLMWLPSSFEFVFSRMLTVVLYLFPQHALGRNEENIYNITRNHGMFDQM